MIVVDASAIYTALAEAGPVGDRFRARLSGEALAAPDLVDAEVASVLRRDVRSGLVDPITAGHVLQDLRDLAIDRVAVGPLIARCWELRDNLTIYDATYAALAEGFDCALVTADSTLANAPGIPCRVELLR